MFLNHESFKILSNLNHEGLYNKYNYPVMFAVVTQTTIQ